MRNTLIIVVVSAVVAGVAYQVTRTTQQTERTAEFTTAGTIPADGTAEALRAMPDGKYLLHTNSARSAVDVVDITDPAQAGRIGRVNLPGTPTDIAISPDGNWALATLYLADTDAGQPAPHPLFPGGLAIINLQDRADPTVADIIGIGHHPTSVAVASSGADLVAVIAVRNGPLMVNSENLLATGDDTTDISQRGRVQVITFNPQRLESYRVGALDLRTSRLTEAGLSNPDDAQPGSIALTADAGQAAATLAHNNGIAVFDPYWLETRRLFSTGERSPIAAAFNADGSTVFTADTWTTPEGNNYSVTAWSAAGEFLWSNNNLPAIKTIAAHRFSDTDFAFALSQQANTVTVYDISAPTAPKTVQQITVAMAPTGIALLPSRGLIAVSGDTGEILLYRRAASAQSDQ